MGLSPSSSCKTANFMLRGYQRTISFSLTHVQLSNFMFGITNLVLLLLILERIQLLSNSKGYEQY